MKDDRAEVVRLKSELKSHIDLNHELYLKNDKYVEEIKQLKADLKLCVETLKEYKSVGVLCSDLDPTKPLQIFNRYYATFWIYHNLTHEGCSDVYDSPIFLESDCKGIEPVKVIEYSAYELLERKVKVLVSRLYLQTRDFLTVIFKYTKELLLMHKKHLRK